jgi:hypothetical protein
VQQIIDGVVPKIDKNKDIGKQRAYFEKREIVFLNDEWEVFIINIWLNALTSFGMGTREINPIVVYQYAEDYGMNKSDTFDVIKQISRKVKHE